MAFSGQGRKCDWKQDTIPGAALLRDNENQAGLNSDNYAGHSYCIGAATSETTTS